MAASGGARGVGRLLICRVGAKVCGLALEGVLETLRPLPVEPLAQMPDFVLGLTLLRGRPTPVVDARRVLGSDSQHPPGRYVALDVGQPPGARIAALAVDEVLGVRRVDAGALAELPGLLRESNRDLVGALGALDAELLLVLEHARLLPEALWQDLEGRRESA